jgi:hypothetical protein
MVSGPCFWDSDGFLGGAFCLIGFLFLFDRLIAWLTFAFVPCSADCFLHKSMHIYSEAKGSECLAMGFVHAKYIYNVVINGHVRITITVNTIQYEISWLGWELGISQAHHFTRLVDPRIHHMQHLYQRTPLKRADLA